MVNNNNLTTLMISSAKLRRNGYGQLFKSTKMTLERCLNLPKCRKTVCFVHFPAFFAFMINLSNQKVRGSVSLSV